MDGWAGQAYGMPAGCKDLSSIPAGEPARKRRSLTLRIAPTRSKRNFQEVAAPSSGPSRWWGPRRRRTLPRRGGVEGSAAAASCSFGAGASSLDPAWRVLPEGTGTGTCAGRSSASPPSRSKCLAAGALSWQPAPDRGLASTKIPLQERPGPAEPALVRCAVIVLMRRWRPGREPSGRLLA
jgi:hypothetical protein